jgi:serine/threonine protein kinase
VGDEPAADAGFPAGNEASAAIGARLGQYRLERRLGGGGMAVVYLARDERLDRPVALKVLAPVLAEDEAFRKRFIRESRAAAAVEDPHIIPVFEAGEAGGMLYIAMRYVPGGDVRTMVRRDGPLPPGRAAAAIAQVASALDAAHAAGLVHRDVKPANMLVDRRSNRSDHVYLADFGLSKKRLAASAGLTGTGQFVGTLDYSAPEQIRGRPADGRTDQYALACAAFELLTGAPPFHHEEAAAVMYAHLSEPPPPVTSRRAGLPPAVDQAVARALAKVPADRYASCQEFADALLQALGTVSPSSRLGASDGPASSHLDRPEFLGGCDLWESWDSWHHGISTPRSCGNVRWQWSSSCVPRRAVRVAPWQASARSWASILRLSATGLRRRKLTAGSGRAPRATTRSGLPSWRGKSASCGGRMRSLRRRALISPGNSTPDFRASRVHRFA